MRDHELVVVVVGLVVEVVVTGGAVVDVDVLVVDGDGADVVVDAGGAVVVAVGGGRHGVVVGGAGASFGMVTFGAQPKL